MATVDHLLALRKAARLEGPPPKNVGLAAKHQMLLHSTAPIQEISDLKPIFQAEAIARASLGRLIKQIQAVRTNSVKLRQATLPSNTRNLTGLVSSTESNCLRLLRTTRGLIAVVKETRGGDEQVENDDEHASSWHASPLERQLPAARLRENFVLLLESETNDAWNQLVDLREMRRHEFEEDTRRLLSFAFPTACSHDLDTALDSPEIAVAAVDWRAAGGARNEELTAVIAQLKNRSTELGAQQKMESEALDLEFLFFPIQ
jgi:hypothetical protein